jgi:hypothetical protein
MQSGRQGALSASPSCLVQQKPTSFDAEQASLHPHLSRRICLTGYGAAITASGARREGRFVTIKVRYDQFAPDTLYRAFDTNLARLQPDYIDLYEIH